MEIAILFVLANCIIYTVAVFATIVIARSDEIRIRLMYSASWFGLSG